MPDRFPKITPPQYGEPIRWQPETARIGIVRFLLAWVVAAAAVALAAWMKPGTEFEKTGGVYLVAASPTAPIVGAVEVQTVLAGWGGSLLGDGRNLTNSPAVPQASIPRVSGAS